MYIDSRSKVLLKNSRDPSKETWLELPFDEDDFNHALELICVEPKGDEDVDAFDQLVNGSDLTDGYYVAGYESDFLQEKHFQNIFAASDLVERIESVADYQRDLLDALIEDGDDLEEAIEECEDGDVEFYPNTNLTDLAEQFGDEDMFSKEFLLSHVDWEAVGRELSFDGYNEVSGGVLRRN